MVQRPEAPRRNPESVQSKFWHDRWTAGQTGFHSIEIQAGLKAHWDVLATCPAPVVFVPLCGKSLDLLWLRDHGCQVAGIELSSIALEDFCMENAVLARRQPLAKFDLFESERLRLYRGDLFALEPGQLGSIDAVYDRAALVAWPPELRKAYVGHLNRLIPSGAKTLLITIEYPQEQKEGPPFSVDVDEVRHLYDDCHRITELSRRDVLASEPRMRARGVTQLHEVCYQLERV